ncbi:hypothetical protein [uncultured Alistipes sp.]|uniref:hypothetical protein n=1 Tax=uncultured Alistipes sp. TaxID=538949 RepID=UPI00262EEFA9|nr:hypothetical protein [uncultured Alistipes sp.]
MKPHLRLLCLSALLLAAACTKDNSDDGGQPDPGPLPPVLDSVAEATVDPFSWTAVDALGRTIEPGEHYGAPREDKKVGIFYFIWIGAHGYDEHEDHDEVMPPAPSDVNAPYDIQKILDRNPNNPKYGPVHAFHHWGEPYLGYYVSNDEWVIRKHAQMLSAAGVDVILLDVTNGYLYLNTVKTICEVYRKMRKEGARTPQIAFVLNGNALQKMADLYSQFYAKGLYKELWFQWKGKPLVLCPPEGATARIQNFFTVRHSWFSTKEGSNVWFGNGQDKWPWGDTYPQSAGWHEAGKPECIPVMPATHPTSNIGRSFDVKTGTQPRSYDSGKGVHFTSQFSRALQVDPEFIFVTGWNEWIAMRFVSEGGGQPMLGKVLPAGGSFFVDQYNHEFSRDLEPLRGGFGDNYYYQLADYVRRFKGTASAPVHSDLTRIDPDDMSVWKSVAASYADDRGDVAARRHHGYGSSVGMLVNQTGRNDIVMSKVANDGENLFFYVRTAAPITPRTDKNWMRLFVRTVGSDGPDWEGFRFMVNRKPAGDTQTSLDVCGGGWNWQTKEAVDYRVEGREMVVRIPIASLGIGNANDFTIDFKWIDNAAGSGDIQECLSDGDAAPDGRFRYRYRFKR